MTAVAYSVSAGVAVLTMDEPDTRNSLTPAILDGLGNGLQLAAADSEIRAVVISHTGPAFCAGAHLKASEQSVEPARFDTAEILVMIQDLSKPVIARIAGHCMGGGVGLAAACDFSVATEHALFGFTDVRIGVAPAVISVVCLPKLRRSDALELFLTGERISAERAAAEGLITAAVPEVALDRWIQSVLVKLKAGGPRALAVAKRLVTEVPSLGRDEGFSRMTTLSQSLFDSEEAAEGIAAFREKRTASWDA